MPRAGSISDWTQCWRRQTEESSLPNTPKSLPISQMDCQAARAQFSFKKFGNSLLPCVCKMVVLPPSPLKFVWISNFGWNCLSQTSALGECVHKIIFGADKSKSLQNPTKFCPIELNSARFHQKLCKILQNWAKFYTISWNSTNFVKIQQKLSKILLTLFKLSKILQNWSKFRKVKRILFKFIKFCENELNSA